MKITQPAVEPARFGMRTGIEAIPVDRERDSLNVFLFQILTVRNSSQNKAAFPGAVVKDEVTNLNAFARTRLGIRLLPFFLEFHQRRQRALIGAFRRVAVAVEALDRAEIFFGPFPSLKAGLVGE